MIIKVFLFLALLIKAISAKSSGFLFQEKNWNFPVSCVGAHNDPATWMCGSIYDNKPEAFVLSTSFDDKYQEGEM